MNTRVNPSVHVLDPTSLMRKRLHFRIHYHHHGGRSRWKNGAEANKRARNDPGRERKELASSNVSAASYQLHSPGAGELMGAPPSLSTLEPHDGPRRPSGEITGGGRS